MTKRLYRNLNTKMVTGVCAGLADYLDIDVAVLRVGAVIVGVFQPISVLVLYVLAAIIMPGTAYDRVIEAGESAEGGRRTLGLMLVAVGGVLLLVNVGWPYLKLWLPFTFNFRQLWPLVFVVAGIALVLNSRNQD